jgi:hypothetical protein
MAVAIKTGNVVRGLTAFAERPDGTHVRALDTEARRGAGPVGTPEGEALAGDVGTIQATAGYPSMLDNLKDDPAREERWQRHRVSLQTDLFNAAAAYMYRLRRDRFILEADIGVPDSPYLILCGPTDDLQGLLSEFDEHDDQAAAMAVCHAAAALLAFTPANSIRLNGEGNDIVISEASETRSFLAETKLTPYATARA